MTPPAQIVVEGVSHHYRPPVGRERAGARKRLARGARAGIPGAARPVRLRQVDPALSHRRLSADRDRKHPGRRQAGGRTGSRPRHRVPELRAVSVEDGAQERALRPRTPGLAARGARTAGAGLHRPRRPHGLRGQLSLAALRRHEATHRDRPHARLRSPHAADGRAVRRARRPDPQPDAGRAARDLGEDAQDRDLRHP